MRCAGGEMQGRLVARNSEDSAKAAAAGITDIHKRYGAEEMADNAVKEGDTAQARTMYEQALKSYDDFYGAYKAIFSQLGLRYVIVDADAGNIGGSKTNEFQHWQRNYIFHRP